MEFDQLEEAVKSLNKDLMRENRHLQDLTTQLQEKHHKISLEVGSLPDASKGRVQAGLPMASAALWERTLLKPGVSASFSPLALLVHGTAGQGDLLRDQSAGDGDDHRGPAVGYREAAQAGAEAEQAPG